MIPQIDHQFSARTFYNFDENLNQPRHRWYPFKEGFSNQLVREAIGQVKRKRNISILDPFSGSGTTPLTSALLGHRAVGIEVNPFCAFASKVKCNKDRWRAATYKEKLKEIVKEVESADSPSPLEGYSSFSRTEENSKWLFERGVLRVATALIGAAKRRQSAYSDAFVLAGIRAAMMCCNAKKDGKCLRYHRDWDKLNYSSEDFIRAFKQVAEMMVGDISLTPMPKSGSSCILVGDAREKLSGLQSRSFDLLVTSPPYLNSFDYSDVYRPELFLGGFVKSNADLRKIRLKTLRSHVQVSWEKIGEMKNPLVKGFARQLREVENLWSSRLPEMIEAYFEDMDGVLKQAARLLRKRGEMWIVVSTSSYYGVHIPVDVLLAELACEYGFSLNGIFVLRNLRGAGQQRRVGDAGRQCGLPLRESLIILKR